MTTLLTDDLKTELGIVRSYVALKNAGTFNKNGINTASTTSFNISLEVFDLQNDWLPDTMKFEAAKGWRWFIEKTANLKEDLIIFCQLIAPSTDTEWNYNSGEYLDAIEIENKTHHLHIGTEDTDAVWARAVQNDWMPGRFERSLGLISSKNADFLNLTEYIDFGFKTTVPDLQPGEKIYFHYLVATNPIKQSVKYPDERDASTWYAVEKSKKFLDNFLKK